jgi:hypothetical protein
MDATGTLTPISRPVCMSFHHQIKIDVIKHNLWSLVYVLTKPPPKKLGGRMLEICMYQDY